MDVISLKSNNLEGQLLDMHHW